MEAQKRRHLVNELMEEALLMKGVLEKALEGKEVEAQHNEESPHIIVDDEPNPLPAFSIQEEHASWEKIFQALVAIETELLQIAQAEQQRMERLSPDA